MQKNKTELFLSTIFGFILSLPLTGFLHGFFTAIGKGSFFDNLKGRFIIGVMEAVASSFSYGAPFGKNEPEANARLRLLTFFVFLIINFITYKFITRKKKKIT
jgi:RsiW-degrading membrane proteinase PrsW (M82 family)